MPTYAILDDNNIVVNVIVANNLFDAKSITTYDVVADNGKSFIGAQWTGEADIFIDPNSPVIEEPIEDSADAPVEDVPTESGESPTEETPAP